MEQTKQINIRRVKDRAETLQQRIKDKIAYRDQVVVGHTPTWQSSESGQDYQARTKDLRNAVQALDDVIFYLGEHLEKW